jgi:hypothetical protein
VIDEEYRLKIEQTFRFQDGSMVLVCRLLEGSEVPVPTTAELLVEGSSAGRIRLTSFRMLGPKQGARHRNVVTYDDIEADVEHQDCVLVPANILDAGEDEGQ